MSCRRALAFDGPADASEERRDLERHRGVDRYPSRLKGMVEGEIGRHKQQPRYAELLAEKEIVSLVAVFRIAYDRVGGMREVAPHLMVAPGVGREANERVSAGLVFPHRGVELDRREAEIVRARCEVRTVSPSFQRIVEGALRIEIATHDSKIALEHPSPAKEQGKRRRRLGIECEEQYPGGCAIEAMDGIDDPPELLSGDLDACGFSRTPCVAMDEYPTWFVEGDDTSVAIEDIEHFSTRRGV